MTLLKIKIYMPVGRTLGASVSKTGLIGSICRSEKKGRARRDFHFEQIQRTVQADKQRAPLGTRTPIRTTPARLQYTGHHDGHDGD